MNGALTEQLVRLGAGLAAQVLESRGGNSARYAGAIDLAVGVAVRAIAEHRAAKEAAGEQVTDEDLLAIVQAVAIRSVDDLIAQGEGEVGGHPV